MFLIEPLIWMFKVKNFKTHFIRLNFIAIICWVLFLLLAVIMQHFNLCFSLVNNVLFVIFAFLLIFLPFLCITGYFWCLTDNIINRDLDVKIGSIYNGKAQFINKIELPDWNILRFIWRGIASIVATIILYIPVTLIVILTIINFSKITSFWHFNETQILVLAFVSIFLLCMIIPALLWNYARRDSVVAVLNLPKAIYIIESYPGKYFLNAILFIIFAIIHSYVIKYIAIAYDNMLPMVTSVNNFVNSIYTAPPETIISSILFVAIDYIIAVYWIYINAYLLGTIAPPSEY